MKHVPSKCHVTMDSRSIYFPEMTTFDVKPKEIIHCLSMICRYNGFVKHFYSVAEHTVLVTEIAEALHDDVVIPFAALFHDAAEAYIGDISKPLKDLLPDYQRLESHIESCVQTRFGLPKDETTKRAVTACDIIALHVESNHLLFHKYEWVKPVEEAIYEACPSARRIRDGIEMPPSAAADMLQRKMEKYGVRV